MAYTVFHAAPTARGTGDGSTHDNAATLFPSGNLAPALLAWNFGLSGVVVLAQNTGSYTLSQALTAGVFSVAAPTATTHQLCMYAADAAGTIVEPTNYAWRCVAEDLDTTNFVNLTYSITTGNMIASNAIHLTCFKITATISSAASIISNPNGLFSWCDFLITSTSSSSTPFTMSATTAGLNNCQIKILGSTGWARILTSSTAGLLENVRIIGSSTGAAGTMYGLAVSNTVAAAISNGAIFIQDCPGVGYINYNTATGAAIQGSRLTIVNCGTGVACATTVSGGASRIVLANSVITGCDVGMSHPYGKYSINNVILRNTVDFGVPASGYVGEPAAYITTETDADLYVDSAGGDYRIITTSENWGKNRGLDQPDTVTVTEVPQIVGPAPVIERSVADTNPITFRFPISSGTITARASINNAAYQATSGTVSFLRTEDSKHYYALSYHANDRPTNEGITRYEFTNTTYTIYVVLRTESLNSHVISVSDSGFRDIFETYSLNESYAGLGAPSTPAQSIYLTQQGFLDFAKSGATITIKKLDGSPAATYILDSASTPSSRTRAT